MNFKNKLKERVPYVIKTDATKIDTEEFLATHVPFKSLKYFKSGIESIKGEEMHEEHFYDNVIDITENKHNMIVVQGESGSGKSHFIKWVKNKLEISNKNNGKEVIVLIERANNTLQDTIIQLLENPMVNEFISAEEKMKLKNSSDEISAEKFLLMLNYNLVVEVEAEENEDEDCELTNRERKKLVEFLKDSIVQENLLLAENGPIERIAKKIKSTENLSEKDSNCNFEENDFVVSTELASMIGRNGGAKKALTFAEDLYQNKKNIRSRVTKYLNEKVEKVIQISIKLNSKDLNEMLSKIRIKLKEVDKSLVLLVEDITAFTGIDKGLVESLIVEHSEENKMCRLLSIVGITNGYYKNYFPDNLKERVTGRVLIDDKSLFATHDDRCKLVARYINALNLEKSEIKRWADNGALEEDLPIASIKAKWASYRTDNKEFSIYPFNTQAIENLYRTMVAKTPRIFIKNIILPMIDNLINKKEFPMSVEEFEVDLNLPDFKIAKYNQIIENQIVDSYEVSRTKAFLRIWGDGGVNYVVIDSKKFIAGIDEDAFTEFNITKIIGNETIESGIKEEIPAEKPEVTIPIKIKIDNIPVETTVEGIEDKPKVKSIEEREFDKLNDELKSWFENGEKLKVHAKIRECIISFIKESIDWELEEVPSFLVKNILVRNNLCIENQLAEIKSNAIILEKNTENYYFMLAVIKYIFIGKKKWSYENAHDDITVCSSWIALKQDEIVSYILGNKDEEYDPSLYNLLIEKHIKTLVGNISKYEGLKEVYLEIMREIPNINKEEVKKILGSSKYLQLYLNYLDDNKYKDNFETIINYFNCKLGEKGKAIFIDSKEILDRIELLMEKNWTIVEISEIKFAELKEIDQKPYEFYKEITNEKFYQELQNNINYVVNEGEKINYISDERNIEVINGLYDVLRNHNISYSEMTYSSFKSTFINDKKYLDVLKYSKSIGRVNLDKAILILRQNTLNYIGKCSEILRLIDEELERLEGKYSQQNSEMDSVIMENELNAKEAKKILEEICTNL